LYTGATRSLSSKAKRTNRTMDKTMETSLMVVLVILIILTIWYYFFRKRRCTSSKDCKAGESCGSDGRCHPFIINGS
jgi:uncharacterized membrane protein affecting hemolysin expression